MKLSATSFPNIPRLSLGIFPTPLERAERLSRALNGPEVFIKRDDLTGLALGGNKTRKLEFLVADAVAQGADTLITAGAAQSNHCRQAAAAALRAGLRCELVLGGAPPDVPNGNLLLDHLFGAGIHWTGMERRGERMAEIARDLKLQGRNPYLIPYGGSNGVGAAGYVLAMREILDQLEQNRWTVDAMVVASSSGGTQAGIVTGAKAFGYAGRILGVSIDKNERGQKPFEEEMTEIGNATARRLGLPVRLSPSDFTVVYDYLGAGYGVVGNLEREAIQMMAKQEGILLDPVYTGRAMGALIEMIRRGTFAKGQNVLFWHTGGAPALFAYAEALTQR